MGKIKKLLAEQKNDVKEIFIRYIATIIAVFLFCIAAIFELDANQNGNVYEKLMVFFAIFACGSFFIETVLKKNKLIMYAVDAFVALLFTVLIYNLEDWVSQDILDLFARWFFLYIIALLGISLYAIIKNTGMTFQGYVNTTGLNFLKWGTIFAVINIGILIIIAIFNSLIAKIDIEDYFVKFEILLFGILYFPYALICLTPKREEKPKFFKVLIKFILVPLLLIAMVIIYLYIFKMIFTGSIPKNEVFGICAGVFIIGFFISTIADVYIADDGEEKEIGIYDKIIKNIKYGFIPTIILEIFAVGIRIGNYGVTADRYIGIVFIIAQLIYIIWEPVNKRMGFGTGYEKLIFVAIIIYFFTVIFPFTNIDYVCYASQKNRMEKALDKDDAVTAHYCINVLKYNRYGKKYLDKSYSDEEIEKIHSDYYEVRKNNNGGYNDGIYISPNYNSSTIDIAGYSRMFEFSNGISYTFDMKDADLKLEPRNSYRDDANNQKDMFLSINDLSDIVNDALKDYGYNDGNNNYDYRPARQYTFGDKKLVITRLSFYYYEDGKSVGNFYMDGYVLIK